MRGAKRRQGRKPVHLIASAPKPQGRDAIWAEIRKLTVFTCRCLSDATDIPDKTIRDYVQSLEAAGIVARKSNGGITSFWLIDDRGIHAPRVRKDGSEVQQGRATEAMWTAMRLLKQFTARELALHASTEEIAVSEIHAKNYCQFLARAKYLRVVAPGKAGRCAKQAVYRFVRFTGPKPLMIQRVKQVFDPNLGEVVWSKNKEGRQ